MVNELRYRFHKCSLGCFEYFVRIVLVLQVRDFYRQGVVSNRVGNKLGAIRFDCLKTRSGSWRQLQGLFTRQGKGRKRYVWLPFSWNSVHGENECGRYHRGRVALGWVGP